MNVLKAPFNTRYETAPFSKIRNIDFIPAFEKAIAEAKKSIDIISSNPSSPNFENTIEALEFSSLFLEQISSIFFNLNAAETNDEIQKIAQEISPKLTSFSNDITLNENLFVRIRKIYESNSKSELTTEQKTLLEKKYKNFLRNGANLNSSEKINLRDIDKKLSVLSLKFGENLLAETNRFRLHVTNKNDLDGLPEFAVNAGKILAEKENKRGWLFSLDYPSYIPFITYIKNRELRKKMVLAFGKRGFCSDKFDNQEIILNIVKLRHKRANLLGYKTHVDYVLEERMAKSSKKVITFLNKLKTKALKKAEDEFIELSAFAKKIDGIDKLEKWDNSYYSEKLKKEKFDIDDTILKPYFKLENVLDGIFKIAEKLFEIQFTKSTEIDTYHKDVFSYKVTNKVGDLVAIFYTDFFPRPGKRNGAWMTSFKPQYEYKKHRPHVSIVCNFTKPTKHEPSLLTFNEVKTLFHEFGHALHGMLADTMYPSLSGTNVAWDFVELPSQLMENWCYEKDALQLFAKHYKTGEDIPMELIEKIKLAGQFQQGMQTLRQLSFGILDLNWHSHNPKKIESVKRFEEKIFCDTELFPSVDQICISTAFAHIFQGGYSSGYYSYKWAEVLDADAFAYFKENGIFNSGIANSFKTNILSKGGTENPELLYKKFRGKKASIDALIERSGLK